MLNYNITNSNLINIKCPLCEKYNNHFTDMISFNSINKPKRQGFCQIGKFSTERFRFLTTVYEFKISILTLNPMFPSLCQIKVSLTMLINNQLTNHLTSLSLNFLISKLRGLKYKGAYIFSN